MKKILLSILCVASIGLKANGMDPGQDAFEAFKNAASVAQKATEFTGSPSIGLAGANLVATSPSSSPGLFSNMLRGAANLSREVFSVSRECLSAIPTKVYAYGICAGAIYIGGKRFIAEKSGRQELMDQLAALRARTKELETKSTAQQTVNRNVQTQIGSLDGRAQELSVSVAALQRTSNATHEQVGGLEARLDTLEPKVEGLEATVAEQRGREEISADVTGLLSRFAEAAALRGRVEALEQQQGQINMRIGMGYGSGGLLRLAGASVRPAIQDAGPAEHEEAGAEG